MRGWIVVCNYFLMNKNVNENIRTSNDTLSKIQLNHFVINIDLNDHNIKLHLKFDEVILPIDFKTITLSKKLPMVDSLLIKGS